MARGRSAIVGSARLADSADGQDANAVASLQSHSHPHSIYVQPIRDTGWLWRNPRLELLGQRRRRTPLVELVDRLRNRPQRRRAVLGQLHLLGIVAVSEHGSRALITETR